MAEPVKRKAPGGALGLEGGRSLFGRVGAAVRFLGARARLRPEVGVILGSGLGALGETVTGAQAISYARIPHFPSGTIGSL